jgi:2-keto-4-pentenoate hydratase/2-oxohepta-3-ene-1,7-dioic acid hydratase in catechol pathway
MRLVTFTQQVDTRVGAFTESGDVADLTLAGVPQTMIELLSRPDGMDLAKDAIHHAAVIPAADVTIEAPVLRPGKVLAIGLNYRDHAEETGQEIPKKPIVFAKVSTCIVGPGHPVYMPKVSRALDYEAELCFVIGKKARYVKAEDAAEYIAGYTVGNDVSVRDWQFHSPTWMMGKGFDTHGPIGPAIVTPDEFDPGNAAIRMLVNNEVKQESNTNQLIFNVADLVEYLSAGFTLEPGDVVFTGTPSGVGVGKRPPEFVKVGDVMRVEIDGLGALENIVEEEPA